MKNIISTICFCIISIIGYSQVWTKPVNISNMNSSIQSCDFVIDNAGIYHCVWNLKLSDSHSVLYYSKSNDNGLSWSNPENISQNNTRYYSEPVIDINSINNLYVAFDNYESLKSSRGVFSSVIIFDGNSWSDVINLDYGFKTRIEIDPFDNVYVFWFQGLPHDGAFSYRSFSNGEWSNTVTPYKNNAAKTFVDNVKSDNLGNLHCVGQYVPTSTLDFYPAYFKFTSSVQQWDSEIVKLSSFPSTTSKIDIDLCSDQLPVISRSGNNHYFYPDLLGNEEIVDDIYTSFSDIVATENDYVNILSFNRENGLIKLKQHWKVNEVWIQYCLDSAITSIFNPKMLLAENYMTIVYEKSDIAGEGDVYFLRTDIQTSSNSNFFIDQSTLEIYPNPAYEEISFTISDIIMDNAFLISICDLQGKIIADLNVGMVSERSIRAKWDGYNQEGSKVSPGVYLCVCESKRLTIVKKFIYLP